MQLSTLLNGKLTYSSGWAAVISGLLLAVNIVSGSPDLPWQMILATILSSDAPILTISGLAIVGFRRKMETMQNAKEMGPEEIQKQAAELQALASDFLAKLQQRSQ